MDTKAKLATRRPPRSHGLAQAKARLSEIIERAQASGAQEITRRGKAVAYVVSADEWRRHAPPPGSLLNWFQQTGLFAAGIDLELPWGQLVARRSTAGRPIGAMDAFHAATALTMR